MLVITALVGTRDLGQEVYIALDPADVGRGLVAGALRRDDRHDRRPADDRRRPRRTRARPWPACDDRRRRRRRAAPPRCRSGPVRSSPRPLAGGITNLNFTVEDAGRRYVVRIGGDIPDARRRARARARRQPRRPRRRPLARRSGTGEPGALVLDFIDGRTFTADDVRDPANRDRLADLRPPLPPRDPASTSAARRRSSGSSRSCATTPIRLRRASARTGAPRPARRAEALEARGRADRDRLRPQRPPGRQHPRRRQAASGWSTGNMPASTRRSSTSAASPRTPACPPREAAGAARSLLRPPARRRPAAAAPRR